MMAVAMMMMMTEGGKMIVSCRQQSLMMIASNESAPLRPAAGSRGSTRVWGHVSRLGLTLTKLAYGSLKLRVGFRSSARRAETGCLEEGAPFASSHPWRAISRMRDMSIAASSALYMYLTMSTHSSCKTVRGGRWAQCGGWWAAVGEWWVAGGGGQWVVGACDHRVTAA